MVMNLDNNLEETTSVENQLKRKDVEEETTSIVEQQTILGNKKEETTAVEKRQEKNKDHETWNQTKNQTVMLLWQIIKKQSSERSQTKMIQNKHKKEELEMKKIQRKY